MLNPKLILNELFFSMNCVDVTDFLLKHHIFKEFECVVEYSPTELGNLIDHLHEEGYDVHMLFSRGISDEYILCKKLDKYLYAVDFLADDNEQFTSTFDFEEKIYPILLNNKEALNWVIKHSTYKLTDEEKVILGITRPLKVKIEYVITNSACSKEEEIAAIEETMGLKKLVDCGILRYRTIQIED